LTSLSWRESGISTQTKPYTGRVFIRPGLVIRSRDPNQPAWRPPFGQRSGSPSRLVEAPCGITSCRTAHLGGLLKITRCTVEEDPPALAAKVRSRFSRSLLAPRPFAQLASNDTPNTFPQRTHSLHDVVGGALLERKEFFISSLLGKRRRFVENLDHKNVSRCKEGVCGHYVLIALCRLAVGSRC
jgi:hypothetical protein